MKSWNKRKRFLTARVLEVVFPVRPEVVEVSGSFEVPLHLRIAP